MMRVFTKIRILRLRAMLLIGVFSLFMLTATLGYGVVIADDAKAPSGNSICDESDASASGFCADKVKAETKNPLEGEDSIFSKILKVLVYATSIISVIMIMIGGLRYVFSGGDANGVKGAKDTILYAIIGLVIALFGQVIITFVLDKL